MKRKLALFLAAVMTLSAFPVAASAAPQVGNIANQPVRLFVPPQGGIAAPAVPIRTVFVENTVTPAGAGLVRELHHNNDDVNWMHLARELVVTLDGTQGPGTWFEVQLTNAEWYFLHQGGFTVEDGSVLADLRNQVNVAGVLGNAHNTFQIVRHGFFNAAVHAPQPVPPATYNRELGRFFPLGGAEAPGGQVANPWAGVYVRLGATSYANFTDSISGGNPFGGLASENGGLGAPFALTIQPGPGGQNRARVTLLDPMNLTDDVSYLDGGLFPSGTVVRIPLVTRTTGADIASVQIVNVGGISGLGAVGQSFAFANSTAGNVVAIISNPETGRNRFPVERVTLREQSVNSIDPRGTGGNAVDLVLPGGFFFENAPQAGGHVALDVRLTGGLSWGNMSNANDPQLGGPGNFTAFFPSADGNRRDRLRIWFHDLVPSTVAPGDILIDGLVVRAEENAPFDIDVMLEIRNTNNLRGQNDPGAVVGPGQPAALVPNNIGGSGAEPVLSQGLLRSDFPATRPQGQTYWRLVAGLGDTQVVNNPAWGRWLQGQIAGVQPGPYGGVVTNNTNMIPNTLRERVATRRDWGFTLSALGTVPELISGRYEGGNPDNYGPRELPENTHHQTARVLFEENVANSWHGGRTAVLTLPEQVKWRAVEIVDYDGVHANTIRERVYLNRLTHERPEYGVRFNDNRLYFVDLLANRDVVGGHTVNERMEITFDAWVSIAAPFQGDVVLTASGSAIPTDNENLPSAVIATAVPPVTIQTMITDARIGFQYQETADIVITETRTGALLRDREVRVTVTDFISVDTFLSPDTTVEVTTANGLSVRNINAGGGGFLIDPVTGQARPTLGVQENLGTLRFEIASQSHSGPAVITLSNVFVRIDRTVPQTNLRPYEVVLWGDAIARNFGLANDQFAVPGISAEYLRVVTVGDGGQGWLAQTVAVTEGESYLTINGVPHSMDLGDGYPATSYISPESESFMVPLRFLSIAFGIRNEQIVWEDSSRTVTITLPDNRIIQFQAESSTMLDNGVPRTITSAHVPPRPVTPEIVGSRLYLPFRFLGEQIFGVEVEWDEATRTAIFNPGAMVSGGSSN